MTLYIILYKSSFNKRKKIGKYLIAATILMLTVITKCSMSLYLIKFFGFNNCYLRYFNCYIGI